MGRGTIIIGALLYIIRAGAPQYAGVSDGPEHALKNLSAVEEVTCGIGPGMGDPVRLLPRFAAQWARVANGPLDIYCTTTARHGAMVQWVGSR